MALDFWPKILLFLLPYLPSQTNLEFCWLCQLEKEIGNEVRFLWQGLFVHKNVSSLAFCCAAGYTQSELFLHPPLQPVCSDHPDVKNPLPGFRLLGHLRCSPALSSPLAPECSHVFYPHCSIAICISSKVSEQFQAHVQSNYYGDNLK